MGTYIAGVSIALATTFMSSLGMTLQKRAHAKEEDVEDVTAPQAPTPAWRQRQWRAGLGFMAVSSVVSLAVFALLGQSVASAMAA